MSITGSLWHKRSNSNRKLVRVKEIRKTKKRRRYGGRGYEK
jgi:hypothetical protein